MDSKNILKGSASKITETLENMVFVNDDLNEHAEMIKQKFKDLMAQKGSKRLKSRMETTPHMKIGLEHM